MERHQQQHHEQWTSSSSAALEDFSGQYPASSSPHREQAAAGATTLSSVMQQQLSLCLRCTVSNSGRSSPSATIGHGGMAAFFKWQQQGNSRSFPLHHINNKGCNFRQLFLSNSSKAPRVFLFFSVTKVATQAIEEPT